MNPLLIRLFYSCSTNVSTMLSSAVGLIGWSVPRFSPPGLVEVPMGEGLLITMGPASSFVGAVRLSGVGCSSRHVRLFPVGGEFID
jgi:hypothetical protein